MLTALINFWTIYSNSRFCPSLVIDCHHLLEMWRVCAWPIILSNVLTSRARGVGCGVLGGIGLQMPQRHRPQRKICKQPVFLQAVQWVLATGLWEQPLRLVKCQSSPAFASSSRELSEMSGLNIQSPLYIDLYVPTSALCMVGSLPDVVWKREQTVTMIKCHDS